MFGTRVSFEFGLQLQKHIDIKDDERRMASTRYRIDTFRYRTRYRIDTKIMVSTRHYPRESARDTGVAGPQNYPKQ